MKIIIIAILVIVLGMLAYDGIRAYLLVKKTDVLMDEAVPFTRNNPNASMRILVLGDSTAVGTGTTDNKYSTASRLAALYPDADVTNLAVNGQRIAGLNAVLDAVNPNQHFDIILIQIGANDIMRLTPMSDIQLGIEKVLTRTQKLGDKVILLHSGNIGDSLFFPWYLRPILTSRSYKVRDIYKAEVVKYRASYVDLIGSSIGETIKDDPKRYYATDLLHLSDDGYGLWFDEIKKQL